MKINSNTKLDFPWWKNNPGYIYLDSSASALKPQCVIDEINYYYTHLSTNPHNNDSDFTNIAYDKLEHSRDLLAQFFNTSRDQIIFTSGATEAANLAAHGIQPLVKKNDEIILTYADHGTNILP